MKNITHDWLIDQVNVFGKVQEKDKNIIILRQTYMHLRADEFFCVQHLMKYGYNLKIGNK
jgi:hypothetical protein